MGLALGRYRFPMQNAAKMGISHGFLHENELNASIFLEALKRRLRLGVASAAPHLPRARNGGKPLLLNSSR